MNEIWLRKKFEEFFEEDLGSVEIDVGDEPKYVAAKIIAEEAGIFCGGKLIAKMLNTITPLEFPAVNMVYLLSEGSLFEPGDLLAEFSVNAEVLREGIRTVLNLIAPMSRIATNTFYAVQQIGGTGCKILDTRKTTPGLRAFEKYAVKTGGGYNHRHGRYDGFLIKKEDIKIDGGIIAAIDRAERKKPYLVGIEVEVETWDELEEVLKDGRVRYILLDNMDLATMRIAVERYGKTQIFEASGVGDKDLRQVAETGVHFISLSSLTIGSRIKMKMRILDS